MIRQVQVFLPPTRWQVCDGALARSAPSLHWLFSIQITNCAERASRVPLGLFIPRYDSGLLYTHFLFSFSYNRSNVLGGPIGLWFRLVSFQDFDNFLRFPFAFRPV